jgi:hypothetical protein
VAVLVTAQRFGSVISPADNRGSIADEWTVTYRHNEFCSYGLGTHYIFRFFKKLIFQILDPYTKNKGVFRDSHTQLENAGSDP